VLGRRINLFKWGIAMFFNSKKFLVILAALITGFSLQARSQDIINTRVIEIAVSSYMLNKASETCLKENKENYLILS
jgi:hypothetical protein